MAQEESPAGEISSIDAAFHRLLRQTERERVCVCCGEDVGQVADSQVKLLSVWFSSTCLIQ